MIRAALLLLVLLAAADAHALRRIAVVVGANGAPAGRAALRYAHADARAFAQMLVDVGDFRIADVHVLLDPQPDTVLRRLDEVAYALRGSEESLLLFYYSGHADNEALYPAGKALSLAALKERLDERAGSVRLGILDACRGGAWTGTKGLHADAPFEVHAPMTLGSEGSVLVASTSGLEDAHEAQVIGGSFFTHHLIAGLRGAADRSGDGEVTVSEAFEYAHRLTIRDSAIHAGAPQTPSFEMNLRGRRDLALARIEAGPSRFALRQKEGPLQVVRLDTGLVVAELPPGERETVVALPPGDYLVRRRADAGVLAIEVALPAGGQVELREEDLQLVGASALAAKGSTPAHGATSLSPGDWELRLAVGRVYEDTSLLFAEPSAASGDTGLALSLGVGLSERITLSITRPGLSLRLGDRTTGWEGLAALGTSFSFGSSSAEGGFGKLLPIASFDGRRWFGHRQSMIAGAAIQSAVSWSRGGTSAFAAWRPQLQAGYTLTLGEVATIAIGANAGQRFASDGWRIDATRPGVTLLVGSALTLADRSLPLVQLHLLESLSIDGYAAVGWDLATGALQEQYLGGFTWSF